MPRNTCSQHSSAIQQAALKLGEQEWLVADSLKTVERTKIPLISLKVHDPTLLAEGNGPSTTQRREPFVRVDISFEVRGTKEMMQPCLIYLHIISLYPSGAGPPRDRDRRLDPIPDDPLP